MTGPLDFFTTSRSGDMVAPNFGAPASFVACWARASGVHVRPVMTAAAPMTALRMRNERRSTPAGKAESGADGDGRLSLADPGEVMSVTRERERVEYGRRVDLWTEVRPRRPRQVEPNQEPDGCGEVSRAVKGPQ